MRHRAHLGYAIGLALWTFSAFASIGSTPSLTSLAAEAELVVSGVVKPASNAGRAHQFIQSTEVEGTIFRTTIGVNHVIKGMVQSGSNISFQFFIPDAPIGYKGVPTGSRIVFLKSGTQGYELADPSNPSLPAPPASYQLAMQSGAPPDRVITALLEQTIESPSVPEGDRLEAIYSLASESDPGIVKALRIALQGTSLHPPNRFGLAVLAALIRRNDTTELPFAESLLLRSDNGIGFESRRDLSYAIFHGIRSTDAIPYLVSLLSAPDSETRRASAFALRNIGTSSAIPGLALALSDNDFETRYYAVIGLGEITNQPEWRPLEDEFRKNEKQYLDYWREWAHQKLHPTAR